MHAGTCIIGSMHEVLQQLQDESGLTTGQIARICDTPKSVVEDWRLGERIPQAYSKALRRALAEIMAIPAETPQERKSLIFHPQPGGPIFKQLVEKNRAKPLHVPSYSAAELLR